MSRLKDHISERDRAILIERIKGKCTGVDDPNGCWTWVGTKRENGYGVLRVKTNGGSKMRSPARVMYACHYGEVAYTHSVLNFCGTKNCCNPTHLRVGIQELELVSEEIDSVRL